MKKMLKGNPPPHVIIVDTNIVWFKEKGPVACPEFEAFWAEHTAMASLELMLPEVVKGELFFQHYSSAKRTLERIHTELTSISSVIGQDQKIKLSERTIKEYIEKKIDKWMHDKRAKLITLPVDTIDWRSLCNSSIWRLPPFTLDPKNPEIEKGFRDSLILESVISYVSQEKREVNIAFICGDVLLRKTCEKRLLAHKDKFTVYDCLNDFSTYLKLTKEKLTNEFIRHIVAKARDKFFKQNDTKSLWFYNKLGERLMSDYKSNFDEPDNLPSLATPQSSLNAFIIKDQIQPLDNGKWWIHHPEFISVEGARHYNWKSKIVYTRRYKIVPVLSTLLTYEPEKTLFLSFSIGWASDVKADGRFQNMSILKTTMDSHEFRAPTSEEVLRYNLQ